LSSVSLIFLLNPPHPHLLPIGEKDEIPLNLPLIKGEETPSFEKGRLGWI